MAATLLPLEHYPPIMQDGRARSDPQGGNSATAPLAHETTADFWACEKVERWEPLAGHLLVRRARPGHVCTASPLLPDPC